MSTRFWQAFTVSLFLALPMIFIVKVATVNADCCPNECPKEVLCRVFPINKCSDYVSDEAGCGDAIFAKFEKNDFECAGTGTTDYCEVYTDKDGPVFSTCYTTYKCNWDANRTPKCVQNMGASEITYMPTYIAVSCLPPP